MNHQALNKATKIILCVLLSSILVIVLLYLNILSNFQKRVESSELRPVSGEGLGLLGILLFYFFGYLLIFIGWLILIINKNTTNAGAKITQLILISIFSVLPTAVVLFVMCRASPNPFKDHTYTGPEHGIYNGKITRYSPDNVLIYEATILNGQKVGKERAWYENGVKAWEKNYIENVLHGESIVYDQSGNKKSVTTYLMGQKTRSCGFYKNGQMSHLFDEDSAYLRYEWWENGQLRSRYRKEPSDLIIE